MKVVDMFGAGLPVCAVNFKCLHELVQHEENGLVFKNSFELANQLGRLFGDPDLRELAGLTKGVESFRRYNWVDNWNENVRPIFK